MAGAPDGGGGAPLHFTDVTAGSGVAMTLTSGRSSPRRSWRRRLALIDYDNDGD